MFSKAWWYRTLMTLCLCVLTSGVTLLVVEHKLASVYYQLHHMGELSKFHSDERDLFEATSRLAKPANFRPDSYKSFSEWSTGPFRWSTPNVVEVVDENLTYTIVPSFSFYSDLFNAEVTRPTMVVYSVRRGGPGAFRVEGDNVMVLNMSTRQWEDRGYAPSFAEGIRHDALKALRSL